MIRKANNADINTLLKITHACAQHMIDKNIYQWNEFYPNKQAFLNDLKRDELYVIELHDTIYGCITISTFMDEEYIPIKWLTPSKKNIYIHRLAILPEQQGQGLAQNLMDYAENYAKANNFVSVRLDTFSQNPRNIRFYECRGYKQLGEIFFPKQSSYPFYCYELLL